MICDTLISVKYCSIYRTEIEENVAMAEKKLYQLMGADGKVYLSETSGTLGGNDKLKIYGGLIARQHFLPLGDFREATKSPVCSLLMREWLLPLDFDRAGTV